MPDHDDVDTSLGDIDPDRRAFLKRMAIGVALTPVVTSFSMAALSSQRAYAQASNLSPGGGGNTQP
ncbi:MAG: hypothetical protein E6G60_21300 [Actinobacteria bacterium]|nr:MAG: hypothetical protein E6G60_21300 [Actinomycetota bacterium]